MVSRNVCTPKQSQDIQTFVSFLHNIVDMVNPFQCIRHHDTQYLGTADQLEFFGIDDDGLKLMLHFLKVNYHFLTLVFVQLELMFLLHFSTSDTALYTFDFGYFLGQPRLMSFLDHYLRHIDHYLRHILVNSYKKRQK